MNEIMVETRADGTSVVEILCFDFERLFKDRRPLLNEVIACLTKLRDTLPPEHKATARCAILNDGSDLDLGLEFEISYERQATTEELISFRREAAE